MISSSSRDRIVVVAVLGALALLLAGSFFPMVDPARLAPRNRLLPPDMLHWLGTDQLGRDVLWRTIVATKVSVAVGAAVTAGAGRCR